MDWEALTLTMPNNSSARRTTVQIPTASGDAIEAWVYLPEGSGPHPAVVMAHGIGGIKAGGLSPFAERFREEGFAAGCRAPIHLVGGDGRAARRRRRP